MTDNFRYIARESREADLSREEGRRARDNDIERLFRLLKRGIDERYIDEGLLDVLTASFTQVLTQRRPMSQDVLTRQRPTSTDVMSEKRPMSSEVLTHSHHSSSEVMAQPRPTGRQVTRIGPLRQFSYEVVDFNLTIPTGQQMVVHGGITIVAPYILRIDGTLTLEA